MIGLYLYAVLIKVSLQFEAGAAAVVLYLNIIFQLSVEKNPWN